MATTHAKKEFRIFSVEANNSETPGSYHLVAVPSLEKFKTYEEAQKWIDSEGDKTDYTILEIFAKS